MKIKYVKLLSSILTIGVFMFLAFGSDDSKDNDTVNDSSSYSTDENESSDDSQSEEEAPDGYKKGESCSSCSGTGYYDHDVEGTESDETGGICAGCNGKGYHWVKK
jgi:hypothetical protein